MSQAPRDENRIPTLLGVSSVDNQTPTTIAVNPTTHALLIDGSSLSGIFLPLTGGTLTGALIVQPSVDTANALVAKNVAGQQIFEIDTLNNWVKIGVDQPVTNNDPQVRMYITSAYNGYQAINFQNTNNGDRASADFGVFNDILSGIDLGITSSTNSDPTTTMFGADMTYLWAIGKNMTIASSSATGLIQFGVGGTLTANIKGAWTTTGLGIGTVAPSQLLQVYRASTDNTTFTGAQIALNSRSSVSGSTAGISSNQFINSDTALIRSFLSSLSLSSGVTLTQTGANAPIAHYIASSNASSNSVNTIFAQYITASKTGAGTETNRYWLYILPPTSIGGAITNQYGFYLGNMRVSGVTNAYAITTGTGLVRLGDQVTITGSQDVVQQIVKANATQTTNIAEHQDSTGAVYNSFGLAGAVFNEGGIATTDFRVESDTEANMIYLDANGDTDGALYFGGTTNGIKVNKGGELTLLGTATVFDDVYPSSVTIGSGGSAPSFTAYNGNLRAYEFLGSGATTKELNMGFQIPHSYKEGSDIIPHIHIYIPDDGTGGVIKYYCEYTWTNIDQTGTVATTTISGTITRAANAGINNNAILSFGTVTGTGKTISSVFMCRIYRNPADVGDTFGASTWLKSADIHFECDTLGSKTATAK